MLNWLAKALNLPDFFLSDRSGGGVIQVSIVNYDVRFEIFLLFCFFVTTYVVIYITDWSL